MDEWGLLHEDMDSGTILELVKGDLLELQVTDHLVFFLHLVGPFLPLSHGRVVSKVASQDLGKLGLHQVCLLASKSHDQLKGILIGHKFDSFGATWEEE